MLVWKSTAGIVVSNGVSILCCETCTQAAVMEQEYSQMAEQLEKERNEYMAEQQRILEEQRKVTKYMCMWQSPVETGLQLQSCYCLLRPKAFATQISKMILKTLSKLQNKGKNEKKTPKSLWKHPPSLNGAGSSFFFVRTVGAKVPWSVTVLGPAARRP